MTIKCYDKLPDEAVKIRTLVFVEEQGFKDEFDSIDEIATHIVMFDGDNPVAVGRFFPSENEGEYIVGRVAVKKEYRGKNLGAEILKACEVEIKKTAVLPLRFQLRFRLKIFIKSRAMCRWVKPILMSIAHTLR